MSDSSTLNSEEEDTLDFNLSSIPEEEEEESIFVPSDNGEAPPAMENHQTTRVSETPPRQHPRNHDDAPWSAPPCSMITHRSVGSSMPPVQPERFFSPPRAAASARSHPLTSPRQVHIATQDSPHDSPQSISSTRSTNSSRRPQPKKICKTCYNPIRRRYCEFCEKEKHEQYMADQRVYDTRRRLRSNHENRKIAMVGEAANKFLDEVPGVLDRRDGQARAMQGDAWNAFSLILGTVTSPLVQDLAIENLRRTSYGLASPCPSPIYPALPPTPAAVRRAQAASSTSVPSKKRRQYSADSQNEQDSIHSSPSSTRKKPRLIQQQPSPSLASPSRKNQDLGKPHQSNYSKKRPRSPGTNGNNNASDASLCDESKGDRRGGGTPEGDRKMPPTKKQRHTSAPQPDDGDESDRCQICEVPIPHGHPHFQANGYDFVCQCCAFFKCGQCQQYRQDRSEMTNSNGPLCQRCANDNLQSLREDEDEANTEDLQREVGMNDEEDEVVDPIPEVVVNPVADGNSSLVLSSNDGGDEVMDSLAEVIANSPAHGNNSPVLRADVIKDEGIDLDAECVVNHDTDGVEDEGVCSVVRPHQEASIAPAAGHDKWNGEDEEVLITKEVLQEQDGNWDGEEDEFVNSHHQLALIPYAANNALASNHEPLTDSDKIFHIAMRLHSFGIPLEKAHDLAIKEYQVTSQNQNEKRNLAIHGLSEVARGSLQMQRDARVNALDELEMERGVRQEDRADALDQREMERDARQEDRADARDHREMERDARQEFATLKADAKELATQTSKVMWIVVVAAVFVSVISLSLCIYQTSASFCENFFHSLSLSWLYKRLAELEGWVKNPFPYGFTETIFTYWAMMRGGGQTAPLNPDFPEQDDSECPEIASFLITLFCILYFLIAAFFHRLFTIGFTSALAISFSFVVFDDHFHSPLIEHVLTCTLFSISLMGILLVAADLVVAASINEAQCKEDTDKALRQQKMHLWFYIALCICVATFNLLFDQKIIALWIANVLGVKNFRWTLFSAVIFLLICLARSFGAAKKRKE